MAAVQGVGGGGIINLASIITSDLVPLAERGVYQGFLVLTWAFAAAIGPAIVRYSMIVRLPSANGRDNSGRLFGSESVLEMVVL